MTIDSHTFNLEEILPQCWQHLNEGTKNRRSGFHHPVLATVDHEGKPKSRVVILREADAANKTLRLNADNRTMKWSEIVKQPAVSLTFYDETEKIQLRVEGTATLHANDTVAETAWNNAQPMSRMAYGTAPGPGAVIRSSDQFNLPQTDDDVARGFKNFGTIIVNVTSMEWLYLKVRGNRRALFDLHQNTAQWLVP
jgi:pyridoxamine 5'-phosphate oxidase